MNYRFLVAPLGIAALVGAGVLLHACSRAPDAPPPLRPVKLVTVGVAAVVPRVELSGEVRARVESKLGFRVGGKILSRRVEAGQRVKRGEELARIDPRDFQLSRSAADSQVAARKADTDLAQSEFNRFVELRKQGYVSEQELERKRVALSAAQSALQQAQSGASLEDNRLGDTVLRADADGVITAVIADVGEVVEPGAAVVVLAQDGAREIATEFPEDRTPLARLAKAEVSLWANPTVKYPAKLREFAASADPVTRTFRARYSVKAPAGALALGQSASLTLTLPPQPGGMRLPTTALTDDRGQTRVWVYDPKTSAVHRAPVQVAGIDGNDVIVAGLPDGAQVVTAGVHVLAEGEKVRPFGATP